VIEANETAIDSLALTSLSGVSITSPVDNQLLTYNGTNWVNEGLPQMSFTASETITASDATWTVPSLGSPVVKVTVIGGGGGGGAAQSNVGAAGGTTTFNAGGAGTVTAVGGGGGGGGRQTTAGLSGTLGLASANGGQSASAQSDFEMSGQPGNGGYITVAYLNLTDVATVNVTVGAGGAGGAAGLLAGGAGGRGEVIVEYVAGA